MDLLNLETLKKLVPLEMIDNINYLNSLNCDWKKTEMETSKRKYIVHKHDNDYHLEFEEN